MTKFVDNQVEFYSDAFTVLRSHNAEHSGQPFSHLEPETRDAFLQYEIGVDLLYNVDLPDMLDIFARINSYSVALNTQEKLNAKYLGVFKIIAYDLGHSYANYFIDGGILTEKQVSRMAEAQLSSDLLVALIGGPQTSKNIEQYYKKYENSENIPDEISSARSLFNKTMSYIGIIYKTEELQAVNWARAHWFYTLFSCVAHSISPLIGLEKSPRPTIDLENIVRWRSTLDELSAKYDEYTDGTATDIPQAFSRFINYAQRRTTDTEARKERAEFVLERLHA